MFLTEYNEEKVLKQERDEGYDEGYDQGRFTRETEIAEDMLKEGLSMDLVMKISKLQESKIREIANSIGITLP